MGLDDLVAAAIEAGPRHVVLTGGEPLIFAGIESLCRELRAAGLHLTIETAGTVAPDMMADLMSISPKLASSTPTRANGAQSERWAQRHEQRRWRPAAVQKLIENSVAHQIKFVVDTQEDCDEVLAAVTELSVAPPDVWIMPQAVTEAELDRQAEWLAPWCEEQGYQYCDRKHIRWYGNRRGT